MRFPDGKELKRSVKDQLRGMRHLIRLLGSDDERNRLARQNLPEAPPELERMVGRTFRVVDGVMTAVESAAAPFRSSQVALPGFRPIATYLDPETGVDEQCAQAFIDDLYRVLKMVASDVQENPLILKTRLAGIHADLLAKYRGLGTSTDDLARELCATLFLSLVRHHPFAGPQEPEKEVAIRQYAAVTLIFGLTSLGALPRSDAPAILTDALLMSGARLETFVAAAREDTESDDLKRVLESLLAHLA